MFAFGHMGGAASSAVVRGRFTNVTAMLTTVFNTSGTTASFSPTAGAPSANRYICGYIANNNTIALTIGGVTATIVSTGINSQYFFYALVPTGTAPTLAFSGLTNATLTRLIVYSFEAASAPTMTLGSTTYSTTGAMTSTIPANGFAIGYSLAGSASGPTGPTVAAGYGSLAVGGPALSGGVNYDLASAVTDVGASGSTTVTFTWTGATSISTDHILFA